MNRIFFKYLVFILSPLLMVQLQSQTLAFPGAEGFGKYTTGGRGGTVIEVTNLDNSGPGSLRDAISQSGARTIIFKISGTIELQSTLEIKNGDLTIAGQTAPGEGICIKNYPAQIKDGTQNVIIRYIKFRMGDEARQEQDSFWGRRSSDIIIDHCTMSWSIDECGSFYDNKNFTMQWCLLSESLYHSYHSKGDHGYGGIWGGSGATFHHNLLAHHTSRTPRFNGSRYDTTPETELVDFVNNVIYNWGFNSAYGGESGNQNIRANYYKYGPATESSKRNRIVEPYDAGGNWYIADNYIYDDTSVTADNWNGGVQGSYAQSAKNKNITEPFEAVEINIQTAEDAYESVLENAGANFPVRDEVDARIIEEVKTGTATYGGNYGSGKGIIDSQSQVGGWPLLETGIVPLDSDHDGMPDAWETNNGLDPGNSADRNNTDEEGYTMLEVYLNDILVNGPTAIENKINIPEEFHLSQNYPNPFNPSTTLTFQLTESANIELSVYDVMGQKISTIVSGNMKAGNYSYIWHAGINKVKSSAVYFARLTTGKYSETIKMLLIK